MQIASPSILNKNVTLIGQATQPVKVSSTDIPNQKNMIFVSRFSWNVRKCLEITSGLVSWGLGQRLPVSKLRPLWVKISIQIIRDITVDNTGVQNIPTAEERLLEQQPYI